MPSLMATLGLNTTAFKEKLLEAQAESRAIGREIGEALADVGKEKVGAFGTVAGLEELSRKTVEYGEKIFTLSARLGISTDAAQKWDYALKQNGGSLDEAAGFFEKLAVARLKVESGAKGSDLLIESFRQLGVSIEDLRSKRLEDIATQIGEAFKEGDPQKLIGALRTVGGKGAGSLVAALRGGISEQLNEAPLIKESDIIGLKEIADDAKSFWSSVLATVGPLVEHVYTGLKGALMGVGALFGGAVEGYKAFIKNVGDSVKSGELFTSPLTSGFRIVGNASKEAVEGFGEAMKGFTDKWSKDREDLEKKLQIGKGLAGIGDVEGIAEVKKEQADLVKMAEQIVRLREEAARIAHETSLREMTAAERVVELQRELEALKSKGETEEQAQSRVDFVSGRIDELNSKGEKGEADKLLPLLNDSVKALKDATERSVEKAKLESELGKARKEEQAEEKKERMSAAKPPEVTALQRVGAFVSPNDIALKDYAQKSEGHLAAIHAALTEHVRKSNRVKH